MVAEKKFPKEQSMPKGMVNETKVHYSGKKAKTPPVRWRLVLDS
jgi:hypothetical protein